jgi:hypothetical protein
VRDRHHPHGPDWATTTEGETAIGEWLQPNGQLPAVCGDHPCYMAGFHGATEAGRKRPATR